MELVLFDEITDDIIIEMLHPEIAALIARVNSIVGNRIFSVHIQSDNNIIWIVFVRIIRVLPILTVKALSSLEILYKLGL